MKNLILILLLVLSSCAGLNEDKCVSTDWTKIGLEDGLEGEKPEKFTEYQKKCEELGVNISESHYQAGYKKGIKQFEFDSEKKNAIAEMLKANKSEKCMIDSDCSQTGICSGSHCRHNGVTCFSNSDCKVEGKCKKESKFVKAINQNVSVNLCKY